MNRGNGAGNEPLPKKVPSATQDQIFIATAKMDRIRIDVNSLEQQVKAIGRMESRGEHKYLYLNEMLTQKLLNLDEIYVTGNENARRKRKRLIEKVQQIISLLDSKVPPLVQEREESNQEPSQRESENAEGAEGNNVIEVGPELLERTSSSAAPAPTQIQISDITAKMDLILKDVNILEFQVKSIGRVKSRNELEYVYPNEMLKQHLLDLDDLDVSADVRAKRRRKRLIDKVQKIIELLDVKVPLAPQEPHESNQEPEDSSQSESEQDQRERRLRLQAQQIEKILSYLESQEFEDAEERDAEDEKRSKVNEVPPPEPDTSEPCEEASTPGMNEGGKAVWHNDYRYKFDKLSTAGTRHFACIKAGSKSYKCPARLSIDKDGNKTATGLHSHPIPPGGQLKEEFYNELRRAVQTQRADIIHIYHEVARKYKDAAKFYPIQKVERSMHRWRAEVRKKGSGKVRNIDDYVKFFETPQGQSLLEYDPEDKRKLSFKVITETVETKEGTKLFKHLALYDEETLKEHEDCTVLQADGTFLSRPKMRGVRQLFTIMARNYDKCFPCVWFLMSSRTAHAYESCLTTMKKDIWRNLEPEEVISDFEEAMEIAWKNVYPDVELTGCYFHFTQAILRNAISKGAASRRNLKDNPERHLIIRMLMALALLPSHMILDTYVKIKILARRKFGTFFDKLFEYFDDYWIDRRGVKRFCVYGKFDRTNNEQESMHRVLNFLFKHRQPHPWQFIDVLIENLKISNFDLLVDKTTMSTSKRKRRTRTILNEADLKRCWDLLRDKPKVFTPLMMVTKVAYSLEDKYIQLGQIHSVIYGDEEGDDGQSECEDAQDYEDGAFEDETGYGFDQVNIQEDAVANDGDGSDEEGGGARIDLSDIEGLLDFDTEDTCQKNSREEDGTAITGPCRIPFDELAEENAQQNEILNQVRCYKKNPASSVTQHTSDPPCRVGSDKSSVRRKGEKSAEKRTRSPVVHSADPGDVERGPTKRKRKSVKSGKYAEYDCK